VAGVPPITPVDALIDIPDGRPVADQLELPVPPLAVAVVAGYARPAVHAGREAGPVTLSCGYSTSEAVPDALAPEASVTPRLIVYEPVVVGVPEITPVLEFSDRPFGSPVAVHANGAVPPPVASVAEYATLFSPFGNAVVAI